MMVDVFHRFHLLAFPLLVFCLFVSGILRALPTVFLIDARQAFGWELSAYLDAGWLELAWEPVTGMLPSDVHYASVPIAWMLLLACPVLLWWGVRRRPAPRPGFPVEIAASPREQSPATIGHLLREEGASR